MKEEFVKPRKVFVDAKEYVESLLEGGLEKDLNEAEDYHEEICETCHGTGFAKNDNRYGLEGDPNRYRSLFPFKHESLWWCPDCYNGVVRRCQYCGKLLPKGLLKCDCETIRERERKEREKTLQEAWDKAEELGPDALGTRFGMCYSEHLPHNEGYFSDWEDFFEAWDNMVADHLEPPKPEYVWGTDEIKMSIDAGNIVENATEELCEEAADVVCGKAMTELQKFLDDWCDHCGAGKSYSQSMKYKVRIPWEVYEQGR